MQPASLLLVLLPYISSAIASPQYNRGRGGGGGGGGRPDSYDDYSSPPNNAQPSSSSSSPSPESSSFSSSSSSTSSTSSPTYPLLISHALLATIAFVLLFPLGAILLRLNIRHPIILKLHITLQLLAYLLFLAAAGLGIYVAIQLQPYTDIWSDPHLGLGLAILALLTIQPVLGWVHHRIYAARALAFAATNRGVRPGRTLWGRLHLWLGRGLITVAMVNGGLGLSMMRDSRMQDARVTRNAMIGYGVAAGVMWVVYVAVTVVWEWKRRAREWKLRDENVEMVRRRRRAWGRGLKSEAESQSQSVSASASDDSSLRRGA